MNKITTTNGPKSKGNGEQQEKEPTLTLDCLKAKNKRGETLSLPSWFVGPTGAIPFKARTGSAVKYDYLHLCGRPVPRTAKDTAASESEYRKMFTSYVRLAQKAESHAGKRDFRRYSVGGRKKYYSVQVTYRTENNPRLNGIDLMEQFRVARKIAALRRKAMLDGTEISIARKERTAKPLVVPRLTELARALVDAKVSN